LQYSKIIKKTHTQLRTYTVGLHSKLSSVLSFSCQEYSTPLDVIEKQHTAVN